MPSKKICIFFSDTGGGHRSAAEAVEAGLQEVLAGAGINPRPEIHLENIAEKSHPINRVFVELYNYLLRHHQAEMRYYYWFIDNTKPNDSELGWRLSKPYLTQLFVDNDPCVIVSVHPMLNHFLARARHELGLDKVVKLITVITDPNDQIWKGWACNDVDLIIAPNDLVKNRLLSWKIAEERIVVLGMPINPDFLHPPTVSKEQFLAHLGLIPQRLTVAVNAGWAGGGNMLSIYRSLAQVERPIQSIFLCGHNTDLFEQAKQEAMNSPIPTAVLPFHDRISDLMAASDLMVTKAGGLTTFEALGRHLPMALDVVTPPMPQEQGTVDILISQNLAQPIHKPSDIVGIVENLLLAPNREDEPLPSANNLDKVGAVFDMARIILAAADPNFVQLTKYLSDPHCGLSESVVKSWVTATS